MGTDAATTPATILVVDDDAGVRALVCEALERAGYETVVARSGEEALQAVENDPPDLAITDVQMGGVSGYEVCRRLRESFGDELPIMFLSGSRTEAYDRVAGFQFGADDYVVKPFDPEELVARVRALLRRATRPSSPPRPANGAREGAGSLTPRELEILRLVASGMSQAEIARELVISPKTVGKHIEHILKKLGVRSRAEAVAYAYRERLIEAG